jgi:hypothetical protein
MAPADAKESQKTVRVDVDLPIVLARQLKAEASGRKQTLDAFVGSVLHRYASYQRYADSAGSVTINNAFFTSLLDAVPQSQLETIASSIGDSVVRQAFDSLNLTYDLDSLVKNYFEPSSKYSGCYGFYTESAAYGRRMTLNHGYGEKWSAFLGAYVGKIVGSATGVRPIVRFDSDSVKVSILNPR